MTKYPKFVYTDDKDMLIYCGYAFYDNSKEELLVLKKILESNLFYYYIKHTSKPYSTGYYSYAKNYLKSFTICPLSSIEKDRLLKMKNRAEVGSFLCKKYGVSLKQITA